MPQQRVKLTKPQREFLEDAATRGRVTGNPIYPPIKRLVSLGFLIEHEGRYGGYSYTITEAGRAALQPQGE